MTERDTNFQGFYMSQYMGKRWGITVISVICHANERQMDARLDAIRD